ncbi:MAG: hypothetical protein U0174_23255 [Polyangiaceae bacterium]
MRRVAAAALGVTMGLSICTTSLVARADADSDAQDLFVRGRDLREKGDLAGAVTLFRKANSLAPNRLGSLRNVAECEEQLGHYASSRRAWLELKRQLLTNRDAKYETWSKDAEDAAARLLPKVAQLTLEVTVKRPDGEGPVMASQGQGGGVEITINGEALPLALAATTLDRDPGHFDIRVAGKDVEAPATQSLDLTAGASKTVKLRVVLKPPPPPDAPVFIEHMHPRRVAGFVTLGFGAASLIASSVTFALRQGALGDLETACPKYETQPCPRSASSAVSKGETMSTLTTVFLISGGVLAATGLTLVLASPDIKEPSAANPKPIAKTSLRLSPAWGGLMLDGGFP